MDHMLSEAPTLIIVRNTTDAENILWRIYKWKSYGKNLTPQKNYHNHFEFYHGPLKYSIYKVKCTKYIYLHVNLKMNTKPIVCTWIINIKYKMFTQKSMLNQKRNLHDLPHLKKGDFSGYWFY